MYGWSWKVPTAEWHRIQTAGFEGWEIESDNTPAFIKLTHVRGAGDVESHALAAAWDDEAKVHFYQRDWTDSGIPFVNQGDVYWSGWWFETRVELDRFKDWLKQRGGK